MLSSINQLLLPVKKKTILMVESYTKEWQFCSIGNSPPNRPHQGELSKDGVTAEDNLTNHHPFCFVKASLLSSPLKCRKKEIYSSIKFVNSFVKAYSSHTNSHGVRMKRLWFCKTLQRIISLAKVDQSSAAIIEGNNLLFQLFVRSSYGLLATHFGWKTLEKVKRIRYIFFQAKNQ